jgi:transcriptional regulator with XRE-family HTH domain
MSANPGNLSSQAGVEQTAAELLRALRGGRSQRAFARRLGYRANPITDWEHGRRFPTALEALRAAHLLGVDVAAAFAAFHVAPPPAMTPGGRFALGPWLTAIRGTTPVAHLAERAGCSRFSLARWLSAKAQPRLPEFLRCVDAITGRMPDLIAALVPIEQVPSVLARHRSMRAARRLAFDAPWTEGVLRVLETKDYRELSAHADGFIARRLGVPIEIERDCLNRLEVAGVIRLENERWCQDRPLTVDTRSSRDDLSLLLRQWTAVGYRRIAERGSRDFFAYNVMSCSRADYERIRELLRRTFREIQSLVASSEPSESVAVLNLHLLELG